MTNQSVCLNISCKSVDAEAEALVHDVNVAAQLSSVVRLTHVSVVVVPTGSLMSQLKERLIPG